MRFGTDLPCRPRHGPNASLEDRLTQPRILHVGFCWQVFRYESRRHRVLRHSGDGNGRWRVSMSGAAKTGAMKHHGHLLSG